MNSVDSVYAMHFSVPETPARVARRMLFVTPELPFHQVFAAIVCAWEDLSSDEDDEGGGPNASIVEELLDGRQSRRLNSRRGGFHELCRELGLGSFETDELWRLYREMPL